MRSPTSVRSARARSPASAHARGDERARGSLGSRRFDAPERDDPASRGVGRARVFRRPSRAYTLRARRLRRRSLATPGTTASTPSRSLPPDHDVSRSRRRFRPRPFRSPIANQAWTPRGRSRARSDCLRRSDEHEAARPAPLDGARLAPRHAFPVGHREGVSVPRGGAFGRSKRRARSARLAACKPVRDDEWNARDRPRATLGTTAAETPEAPRPIGTTAMPPRPPPDCRRRQDRAPDPSHAATSSGSRSRRRPQACPTRSTVPTPPPPGSTAPPVPSR